MPSTRSSQDAMLPSESSASGLAGLKVFEMYKRSFRFCYKTKDSLSCTYIIPIELKLYNSTL